MNDTERQQERSLTQSNNEGSVPNSTNLPLKPNADRCKCGKLLPTEPQDAPTQTAILKWAADNFGHIAKNPDERGARLVEEALEVAQAQGVPVEVARRILERVYSRPVGELAQEIGGCAIILLALAENAGLSYDAELSREWRRVRAKSPEWWHRKHAEKVEAGTANLSSVAE